VRRERREGKKGTSEEVVKDAQVFHSLLVSGEKKGEGAYLLKSLVESQKRGKKRNFWEKKRKKKKKRMPISYARSSCVLQALSLVAALRE